MGTWEGNTRNITARNVSISGIARNEVLGGYYPALFATYCENGEETIDFIQSYIDRHLKLKKYHEEFYVLKV